MSKDESMEWGDAHTDLQVGEELAAHDALEQQVQVRLVLEAGHQVHHEQAVALSHDLLLALHVLLQKWQAAP